MTYLRAAKTIEAPSALCQQSTFLWLMGDYSSLEFSSMAYSCRVHTMYQASESLFKVVGLLKIQFAFFCTSLLYLAIEQG